MLKKPYRNKRYRGARLGDFVKAIIYDHGMRSGSLAPPLEFEVSGKFIAHDKTQIVLSNWIETNNTIDENTEHLSIIKGAVKTFKRLS